MQTGEKAINRHTYIEWCARHWHDEARSFLWPANPRNYSDSTAANSTLELLRHGSAPLSLLHMSKNSAATNRRSNPAIRMLDELMESSSTRRLDAPHILRSIYPSGSELQVFGSKQDLQSPDCQWASDLGSPSPIPHSCA